MECLCGCGREGIDQHHFPQAIGMGRNRKRVDLLPTVPLCRVCHTECHMGLHTETLIAKAPVYWQSVGEWERAEPVYERWLARREYRVVTGGQR